jgi:putative ubiquitin-RnfH superfamily antitoxin RatB of RatAB toxin-antitoxin module
MPDATQPDVIQIEIVYADADRQILRKVKIAADSTVADALLVSGIFAVLPVDFVPAGLGIFGHTVKPATRLRDGDRIELYRPLLADPKESRRRRAAR